ncbi:MAG: hypothetical protein J1E98_05120 [Lachnospiraceae bacterium]|nr:hypothetical protein [Lachnospiraceae bacterium]
MKENRRKKFLIIAIFECIVIIMLIILYRWSKKKYTREIEEKDATTKKDSLIKESLTQWVRIEHERKNIAALLNQMGYRKVAIYGYGFLGKALERVLQGDDTATLSCVIDKNAHFREHGEKILQLKDELPELDVIIVTSLFYYEEINEELKNLGIQADIISLDALLFQL